MTTAISSRVVECLKLFRSVSIANIERGRFETWSGNVGAHQKGRSSLDSRLRDAPHISGVMVDFLDELKDALGEGMSSELVLLNCPQSPLAITFLGCSNDSTQPKILNIKNLATFQPAPTLTPPRTTKRSSSSSTNRNLGRSNCYPPLNR
jgi:hypothetical protein